MADRQPFSGFLDLLEAAATQGVSEVRAAVERKVRDGVQMTPAERRRVLAWARGLNTTADVVTELLSGAARKGK